jgi:hypothetical protein
MEAVWILSVIFTFIIIISTIDHRYNLRKKKIDAALRMREMEMGLPPGTYSSTKVKSGKKRNRWILPLLNGSRHRTGLN